MFSTKTFNSDNSMNPLSSASRSRGFTLIEILITIAILAIIVSIAFPSYQRFVLDTNRAEGKTAAMQTAQTLERCFTRFSSYADPACSIGNGFSGTSEKGKYTIGVVSDATSFTVTVSPVRSDPECEALTLTHTGARGESGTGTVDDCW